MEINQLNEVTNVRQRENEGYRRWFSNSYFDLILWYDKKDGDFFGFQLCYSKNKSERAFSWTREYSSSHFVSDTIMENGFSKMSTGILKGDGGIIPADVIDKFINESKLLDSQLQQLIIDKVGVYNSSKKQ